MYELFQLLIDRLKTVPLVKSAKIYNAQVANIPDEKAVKYPCVYVEIANVRTMSRPGLMVQDMSATLRLRVINNSPKQETSSTIYTIKDQVHQYMNNYSGDGKFRNLMRTGEILSYNHDNLYEYQLEYALGWVDITPPVVESEEATINVNAVNLEFDLDIDNSVLRTGDNDGYSFQ